MLTNIKPQHDVNGTGKGGWQRKWVVTDNGARSPAGTENLVSPSHQTTVKREPNHSTKKHMLLKCRHLRLYDEVFELGAEEIGRQTGRFVINHLFQLLKWILPRRVRELASPQFNLTQNHKVGHTLRVLFVR